MLLKYATADVPPEPPAPRTTKLPPVELSEAARLFDNLDVLSIRNSNSNSYKISNSEGAAIHTSDNVGATSMRNHGAPVSSFRPLGAEELGLGFGLILYRVTSPVSALRPLTSTSTSTSTGAGAGAGGGAGARAGVSGSTSHLLQSIEISPYPADRALVYVDGAGVGSVLRPSSRLALKVSLLQNFITFEFKINP